MPGRHRRLGATRRWPVSPPTEEQPNLVISDYLLANGKTGVDVNRTAARRVRRPRSPRCSSAATPRPSACAMRIWPRSAAAAQAGEPRWPCGRWSISSCAPSADLRRAPSRSADAARTASVRFVDPQRLQDGGDMVLHRRLGELEPSADRLVALALHHQRQHVDLPFGQSQVGRR